MCAATLIHERHLRGIAPLLAAFALCGACLAADRASAEAAYSQGNGLFDQGDFPKAAAAYARAVSQDPSFAPAYHNLALADEMVDRQKAIQEWRRFIEVAGNDEGLRFDVGRARARLQLLEKMPHYPEGLQPSHYVPEAGDYYWDIAGDSEGNKWTSFPLKVFLGNPTSMKWLQGSHEAFDVWSTMFPLELVIDPSKADIRIDWSNSVEERGEVGQELEWTQVRRVGDQLTGRMVCVIMMDLSRDWSKDEMRAIITHEMGHALGIKGHSDSKKDIMYWQIQERQRQIPTPNYPLPVFWKSLVKNPSQRDMNTLIRLYNCAGLAKRMR
jgi:predicted Zn-dependent protease